MKVGINGFGRIGKNVYRVLVQNGIEVPLINDPHCDPEYIKYMLKYDSVYGQSFKVTTAENCIVHNSKQTNISNETDPQNIKWRDMSVDLVIEASGLFTTKELASKHNVDQVIITAPSPDVPMYIYGVNHADYNGESIISAASCTTNCVAPLAKVIDDHFTIKEGTLTTVHSVTASQKTVDSKGSKKRLSRTCFNIIPTSTGATAALGKVLPNLNNKIGGMAFRVPVPDVSVIDFVVKLEKSTSLEEIKEVINKINYSMRDILSVTEDEIVSSDMIGCSTSCVLDLNSSIEISPTFLKLVAWYDNEYGYVCRVVDLFIYLKNRRMQEENAQSK